MAGEKRGREGYLENRLGGGDRSNGRRAMPAPLVEEERGGQVARRGRLGPGREGFYEEAAGRRCRERGAPGERAAGEGGGARQAEREAEAGYRR